MTYSCKQSKNNYRYFYLIKVLILNRFVVLYVCTGADSAGVCKQEIKKRQAEKYMQYSIYKGQDKISNVTRSLTYIIYQKHKSN